jgi:hypothetical protein
MPKQAGLAGMGGRNGDRPEWGQAIFYVRSHARVAQKDTPRRACCMAMSVYCSFCGGAVWGAVWRRLSSLLYSRVSALSFWVRAARSVVSFSMDWLA